MGACSGSHYARRDGLKSADDLTLYDSHFFHIQSLKLLQACMLLMWMTQGFICVAFVGTNFTRGVMPNWIFYRARVPNGIISYMVVMRPYLGSPGLTNGV
jgi:hypothetical protein